MGKISVEDTDKALEQLAKVPAKFVWRDTEYKLSPLGICDLAGLRKWAKNFIIQDARETEAALGEEAGAGLKQKVWDMALEDLRHPLTSSAMSAPEIVEEFLFFSLKKSHSGITRATVQDMVKEIGIKELTSWMNDLNALPEADDFFPKGEGPVRITL